MGDKKLEENKNADAPASSFGKSAFGGYSISKKEDSKPVGESDKTIEPKNTVPLDLSSPP